MDSATRDMLLDLVVQGKNPLPNAKPLEPLLALERIGYGVGDVVKRGYVPRPDGSKRLARFFLRKTQRGEFDGTGVAVVTRLYKGETAEVFEFAMCEHDVTGTGTAEESRRGWNPAHCRKCGLDMSVDSSD